ncbi:MAG: DUF1232 domain-containing protein [Dehalococcoidia bacterium]
MPVLIALLVLLGLTLALGWLGLASERAPRVAAVLPRLNRLSHGQRGRLGVWVAKDPRFPWGIRILPLTAFVYWVTPIDLIPDGIPRIGYLDDRAILALSLRLALRGRGAEYFEEHLQRVEYLQELRDAQDEGAPEEEDPAPL